jgi:predicted Rossmann fold nucleotide-binding protein DprA/Smf involved in DNA uptake
MRTIIAGSRNIENYAMLAAAVKALPWNPTLVISGGAAGVDTMGERWAKENGIGVEVFQADWESLGKRAGFVRNEDMAKRAEALLALWP